MTAAVRWGTTCVALVALAVLHAIHPVVVLDWWMAMFFCAFAAASDIARFRWRSFDLDVGFVALIPVFLLRGPLPAAALCFLGVLAGRLVSKRRLDLAAFDASRASLGAVAGSAAYQIVSPRSVTGGPGLVIEPAALACFLLAFIAVMHVLAGIEHQVRAGRLNLRLLARTITSAARRDLPVRTLSLPLGYAVAWLHTVEGLWGAAVLAIPVAAFARIFSLHTELLKANGELTILYDVARRVGNVLELERLFSMIAEAAGKVVSHDVCSLYLWNDTRQELTRSLASPPVENGEAEVTVRSGEGIVGAAIMSREPQFVADASKVCPSVEHGCARTGSLLVVPLVVEDGLVGAIELGCASTGRFSSDHLRMLTILASQASVAIANAILYRRTEQSAITDPLTGLFNYRHLHTRLSEELRRASANDGHLALVCLDLDRFKRCNDTYGHMIGDRVLIEFAAIVRKHIRDQDIPVRYAGDEFVLIIPGAAAEEAHGVADRIRTAVAQHVFLPSDGIRVQLTVSAGIASFPDSASTESELIRRADQAMYAGKKQGSNRVSVAD